MVTQNVLSWLGRLVQRYFLCYFVFFLPDMDVTDCSRNCFISAILDIKEILHDLLIEQKLVSGFISFLFLSFPAKTNSWMNSPDGKIAIAIGEICVYIRSLLLKQLKTGYGSWFYEIFLLLPQFKQKSSG